jgi:hypothetical protein
VTPRVNGNERMMTREETVSRITFSRGSQSRCGKPLVRGAVPSYGNTAQKAEEAGNRVPTSPRGVCSLLPDGPPISLARLLPSIHKARAGVFESHFSRFQAAGWGFRGPAPPTGVSV